MARKNYPEEFKRDAVALYHDTASATITHIVAELGCQRADTGGVVHRHRRTDPAPKDSVDERARTGIGDR